HQANQTRNRYLSAPRTRTDYHRQDYRDPGRDLGRPRGVGNRGRMASRRDRGDGNPLRKTLETAARNGRGHASIVDAGGAQLPGRAGPVPRDPLWPEADPEARASDTVGSARVEGIRAGSPQLRWLGADSRQTTESQERHRQSQEGGRPSRSRS